MERRIQAHTGRRTGVWEVSCAAFGVSDKKKPPIHVVSTSDTPGQRIVVTSEMVVEVGEGFSPLLRKISRYEQRSLRSVRGHTYDFVDLVIRIGHSFDKSSPVDVVVEIEYRPCLIVEDCESLVDEMMKRITAPLIPPQVGQDRMANAVAAQAYTFERVIVDVSKALPGNSPLYSDRHAALHYIKVLG